MDCYALKSHDRCDRCFQHMSAKIMSYFSEELICMDCLRKERDVRAALRDKRVDVSRLEGCGFLPEPEHYRERGPDRGHDPERRRGHRTAQSPAA